MIGEDAERIAHHKIRNNLQIVSSLINLQLHASVDPPARAALSAVQQRIHALALVHYDLPEAGNLQSVELGRLLPAFCRRLQSFVSTEDHVVEITSMIAPIQAHAGRAVVLAMLISEMVIYLAENRFGGQSRGWVLVQALLRDNGNIGFVVAGEGAGSGATMQDDALRSRIVGSYLRQLRGDMTYISNGIANGLQVELPSLAA